MLLNRVSFSRWRWLVLLAVHICLVIIDGIPNATGVLLVHWKQEFDASTAQLSVVLSIQLSAYHLAGAFAGAAVHKLDSRPVVVACGCLSCLGLILSSIAPSPVWLYLTAGLIAGSGFGGILNASTVCISQYFTKYYTVAQSLASVGSAVGIMIMPPLTQYLVVGYGWRGAYLILAGLAGNLVVCGMLLRPVSSFTGQYAPPDGGGDGEATLRKNVTTTTMIAEEDEGDAMLDGRSPDRMKGTLAEDVLKKADAEENNAGEEDLGEEQKESGGFVADDNQIDEDCTPHGYEKLNKRRRSRIQSIGGATGFSILFKNYRFTLIVCIIFFSGLCLSAVINHFVLSVVDRGIDEQSASFLMSFLGIGSIVSRFGSAVLLGKKLIDPLKLFVISVWGSGISIMLMRLPRTFGWFVVVAMSEGVFTGINICTAPMVTRMCVGPAKLGRAFGVLMVFAGIGCLIGPILAGLIYDATKSFDISFYLFGGLMTSSGVALLFIGRIKQPEERANKEGAIYRSKNNRSSQAKLISLNRQNSEAQYISKTTTVDDVTRSDGDEKREKASSLKVVFDVGNEDETSTV